MPFSLMTPSNFMLGHYCKFFVQMFINVNKKPYNVGILLKHSSVSVVTCFMHDFVVSDDLNTNFLTTSCDVSGPNDV
jgi:hypothetical protein